jgi:hypothetical protein
VVNLFFKKKPGFGTLGILLGIAVAVISIAWVAFAGFSRGKQTGNDVTWVG